MSRTYPVYDGCTTADYKQYKKENKIYTMAYYDGVVEGIRRALSVAEKENADSSLIQSLTAMLDQADAERDEEVQDERNT